MLTLLKKLFSPTQDATPHGNILVVDDTDVDRHLAEKVLTAAGFTVTTAINGEEGLNAVRQQKPDLILLDCQMPVMDGQEMCRRLKENPQTKHIPVIFLTSLDTPKNIIDSFTNEAENFLHKPLKTKVLLSEIKLILAENRIIP